MSEPKPGRTTMLLGIAALGTSAALCGGGGLAIAVLSARGGTAGLGFGGEPPPPGNPKGSFYEAPDAGPPLPPPPGNPKGSLYESPDAGLTVAPPVPYDELPPPSKR